MPEPATNSGKSDDTPPAPVMRAPVRKRGRLAGIIICCLVLLLELVLVLRWHSRQAAAKAQPRSGPPAVQVATTVVRKGEVGIYVNALGAVTPVNTVMVKSRVDGQLVKVNYVEGQMVKAGDSLVEIDPQPYEAQLTQAEGQLARDKALLENAHVDLDRYQIAYAKNAIPKQQLDTQLATVHQYDGAVKYDEGQVETARLQVAYSHIAAPISGRVGLRLVDAGNVIHATDTNPLAVITQLQPITLIFSVAEDYLPQIQQQLNLGRKLVVEAYDRAQQKKLASGYLLTLDNEIDTNTGTIKLKALFTNEDNALFPNQFVNARLLIDTERNATVVPTAAVQRNAQGAFVYVLQTNQTVAMRPISVGTTDGNQVAVNGVEPGEVLAADNFNRLQEGSKIAVRKPVESPPQAAGKSTKVASTEPGG